MRTFLGDSLSSCEAVLVEGASRSPPILPPLGGIYHQLLAPMQTPTLSVFWEGIQLRVGLSVSCPLDVQPSSLFSSQVACLRYFSYTELSGHLLLLLQAWDPH